VGGAFPDSALSQYDSHSYMVETEIAVSLQTQIFPWGVSPVILPLILLSISEHPLSKFMYPSFASICDSCNCFVVIVSMRVLFLRNTGIWIKRALGGGVLLPMII